MGKQRVASNGPWVIKTDSRIATGSADQLESSVKTSKRRTVTTCSNGQLKFFFTSCMWVPIPRDGMPEWRIIQAMGKNGPPKYSEL